MGTYFTDLANGQTANAATFNAPLDEIDDVIGGMLGATQAFLAIKISNNAGTSRGFTIESAGSRRFYFLVTNGAESGSNAGSDFQINRYDDSGTFIAVAMKITRATGATLLGADVEIDGALNHDGSTVGFFGATPVAKPTVFGSHSGGITDVTTSLCDALEDLGLINNTTIA